MLFDKVIDQKYLLSLSIANGVLPLLYKQIQDHPTKVVDNGFKEQTLAIRNKNFFMSAQLLQLVYILSQKNIQIIPLKGPLLGQHAYGDIGFRPFSDLDILVREEDLLTVAQTLLDLGYTNEDELSALSHPYVLQRFTDISFVHGETGLVIELHWRLLKSASAALNNIPLLFDQATERFLQNMPLKSLPLEEEFLYLCIHASKHRWERIEWMNDINLLFEIHQHNYDWERLLTIAQDEGALIPYLLGLLILKKIYSRDLDHAQTNELIKMRKIAKLYNNVMELHAKDYILQVKKEGIRWMEVFFSIRLEESLSKKVKLFANIFFPLYKSDILAAPGLGKCLRFLYYLKRIQRFFKRPL